MSAFDKKKVYGPPLAGLNDKTSPLVINEDEAAEMLNWEINERGILEKYRGYTKDHAAFPDDPDSFIRFLLNLKQGTSVDILLMGALDDGNTNATYKVDLKKTTGDGTSSYIGHTTGTASFTNGNTAVVGVGTAWLSHLKAGDKIKATAHADSAYTEIASVTNDTNLVLVTGGYIGATAAGAAYTGRIILHKDFMPRGAVFNNYAIITNGSERPMRYNNTTLDKLTDADAPAARYIEAHKRRVFFARTTANPSRIFWCAANDESSYDAAANDDIFPQDNGQIVGIKTFADSLIVFKNNGKVYQVVGNFSTTVGAIDYIRQLDVPENIGIIPERSHVVHNGYLYFMAETGLYRIDPRLSIEKVSFNPDGFIDGLSFTLGPSSAKTYSYDSKTEWDAGTHSGTRATTDGKLTNYFDDATITDFQGIDGTYATVIDSSANVHVFYLDLSNQLVHALWAYSDYTGASITKTVIASPSTTFFKLAADIAPNGTVGLFYKDGTTYKFVEYTSGVWGSIATVHAAGGVNSSGHLAIKYRSDNVPRACVNHLIDATPSSALYYYKRSGSTWSTVTVINTGVRYYNISLALNSSDQPRIATNVAGDLKCYLSNDDGATAFTLLDTGAGLLSATATSTTPIFCFVNSSGQAVTGFRDNATSFIKLRNHTVPGTSAVVSAVTNMLFGFRIDSSDLNYAYYSDSANTEKYFYESATTVTNTTTATSRAKHTGQVGMHANTGVFASVAASASVTSLLCRRLSFRGIWISQERSDSTLSAWGSYEITGDTTNGNTVTHAVAIAAASPATSYATVINGQTLSATTNIYIKNKITIQLIAFAQSEIGAIIDNYTASGVDAKQVIGISFDNELFYACARTSATENDRVLISDIADSFIKTTYPVSAMERYKGQLYAGKSTNGDLLILKQGYLFGATSYSADFQSKEDFLGSIELEKDISKIYVIYEVKDTGSFIFSYRTDSFATSGGSTWTDTTVDQTLSGIKEIPIGKKARSLQFRIQNTGSGTQTGIISWVVVFGDLNIR